MSRLSTAALVANALLLVGALVPLAASGFRGMAFDAHPVALIAGAAMWTAGIAVAFRSFSAGRREEGTWTRVFHYVPASSATVLLLGMTFGFIYHPSISTSFFGSHFTTVLMVTLAVMGMQITVEDWKGVVRDVKAVAVLVAIRWLIMPLTGYCVAFATFNAFLAPDLAATLAIGMMLLCTSPPGAASNSLTLISRGDLALSVSATGVNVLIAPFLQPLLVSLFVGGTTAVDAGRMFLDLALFVLAPVVGGTLFGAFFPRVITLVRPALGPIAVISLALVLMGTIAKGAQAILGNLAVLPLVLLACVVQGLIGLTLGYQVPKYFGLDRRQRVAASFEVGVENAAIAPALALTYFTPLAMLPAVVYGKTQNLMAVAIFVRKFRKDADREDRAAAAADREGAALGAQRAPGGGG